MSEDNFYQSIAIAAGADFSGTDHMHKAVVVAGTVAATAAAIGLLKDKGASGENVRIGYFGVMKYIAGAAITAGTNLTVTTSGFIVSTGSASGTTVGKAMETASSGDLVKGMFNFSQSGPLS